MKNIISNNKMNKICIMSACIKKQTMMKNNIIRTGENHRKLDLQCH